VEQLVPSYLRPSLVGYILLACPSSPLGEAGGLGLAVAVDMGDWDLADSAVEYRTNNEDTDCQAEFPGPAEEGEERKAGSRLAGAVCRVSYARKPLERCV
jgi:hypothetical protein